MNDPDPPFDERDFPGREFPERDFPEEAGWLDREPPADLVSPDFVARTLDALRGPTPEQLLAFAPPTPSPDFVLATLAAVQQDRRGRWREMLTRYVAPNPSPDFVSRTLLALREDAARPGPRRRGTLLWFGLPLLAAAAMALVYWLPRDDRPRLELRAVATMPAAFGAAHTPSLLPALFLAADRAAEPAALADTGADGIWILLQGARR